LSAALSCSKLWAPWPAVARNAYCPTVWPHRVFPSLRALIQLPQPADGLKINLRLAICCGTLSLCAVWGVVVVHISGDLDAESKGAAQFWHEVEVVFCIKNGGCGYLSTVARGSLPLQDCASCSVDSEFFEILWMEDTVTRRVWLIWAHTQTASSTPCIHQPSDAILLGWISAAGFLPLRFVCLFKFSQLEISFFKAFLLFLWLCFFSCSILKFRSHFAFLLDFIRLLLPFSHCPFCFWFLSMLPVVLFVFRHENKEYSFGFLNWL
jgi:hypothetical protein